MEDKSNMIVMCCFCGKSLSLDEAVVLIIKPDIHSNEEQDLYCHKACLTKHLDKSVPLHPELEDNSAENW